MEKYFGKIKTRISKVIFTVEVNGRLVGKRFCGRILIGKGRIRFFVCFVWWELYQMKSSYIL